MMFRFILLVLPASGLAKIDVLISGKFNGDASDMKIYFEGDDIGTISDTEKNTFNLSDDNLKNGIKLAYGKRPDNVYLHSPTPWGDLYAKYTWAEVIRVLLPRRGWISDIFSDDYIYPTQYFTNNSTKEATVSVDISPEMPNMFSSSWRKEGELSVSRKINYSFDINIVEADKDISSSYTSSWGENTVQWKIATGGPTLPVEMLLKPGQSVIVQLYVTRVRILISMEYEATLFGMVAMNYANTYNGHHFRAARIEPCMESAGLINLKTSKEFIEYDFYADTRVVVLDSNYGRKLVDVIL